MLVSHFYKYISITSGSMIISEYKRKDGKNQETATVKHGHIKSSYFPKISDHSKRFKNFIQDLEKINDHYIIFQMFQN